MIFQRKALMFRSLCLKAGKNRPKRFFFIQRERRTHLLSICPPCEIVPPQFSCHVILKFNFELFFVEKNCSRLKNENSEITFPKQFDLIVWQFDLIFPKILQIRKFSGDGESNKTKRLSFISTMNIFIYKNERKTPGTRILGTSPLSKSILHSEKHLS